MPTENATLEAVDALPTVEADATVKQLKQGLDNLANEEQQIASDLQTAKAEAADAASEVEDLEVEQYADPDVTAEDVEAARKRLAAEQDEVERLKTKADRIEKAIGRVRKRLNHERDEAAGRRVYDKYAPVALATAEAAEEAISEALDALAVMNAFRAKAKANNVRPSADYDKPGLGGTFSELSNRNNATLEDALRAARDRAVQPIEGLQKHLS